MKISCFTGGIFDTNAYFLDEHGVLFDAPEGIAEWLDATGRRVEMLLLTHGHIDHVVDAARIRREHRCRVGYHADGTRMLTEPGFFRKLGFQWDIEAVAADELIEEGPGREFAGVPFDVLLVPGHCPGSLCFHARREGELFGGDVLFAGGVGRWDLPGGDRELLLSGIRKKLFPLGDAVRVWPGHGPGTTIGEERRNNPFAAE
jgi:hydroxyacylglutathione hydrolase